MTALIADIAHGEVGWADVLFLAAFILFVIAFVVELPMSRPGTAFWRMLVAAALACVALALMLL